MHVKAGRKGKKDGANKQCDPKEQATHISPGSRIIWARERLIKVVKLQEMWDSGLCK